MFIQINRIIYNLGLYCAIRRAGDDRISLCTLDGRSGDYIEFADVEDREYHWKRIVNMVQDRDDS